MRLAADLRLAAQMHADVILEQTHNYTGVENLITSLASLYVLIFGVWPGDTVPPASSAL